MALIETRVAPRVLSVRALVKSLRKRQALWRSRRALARLDAHMLKDIGLTPEQARYEAELPVWDVPANWTNR